MTAYTGWCLFENTIPLKLFILSYFTTLALSFKSVAGPPTVPWQSSTWFMKQIMNGLWGAEQYLLPIWIRLSDSEDMGWIRIVWRVKTAMFVSRLSRSTKHNELFWKQDKWIHIGSKGHTENPDGTHLHTLHPNDLKQICSSCCDSAVWSYCSQHYDSIRFQSFDCAEWV